MTQPMSVQQRSADRETHLVSQPPMLQISSRNAPFCVRLILGQFLTVLYQAKMLALQEFGALLHSRIVREYYYLCVRFKYCLPDNFIISVKSGGCYITRVYFYCKN